ncbi:MAG: tRNA preQ1(34) S-adenosylmethionine ribosyltransferase-isomerase QueA [Bradymonadaceae bacterium]
MSTLNEKNTDLDEVTAYDYELPEALVAAHPTERRERSRLLVARRKKRGVEDLEFSNILDHLESGDLLVFNDTRVVPGRIMVRKETGGAVELLVLDVLEPGGEERWQQVAPGRVRLDCMTRASKRLRPGMVLSTLEEGMPALFEVLSCEPGRAQVEVSWSGSALDLLEAHGRMPLPPYIVQRREALGGDAHSEDDSQRYQTVYARRPGAIAAPTAGLHFSHDLLARLDEIGVERAHLTLTVGPGTFQPVKSERLSEHAMHSEEYIIDPGLAESIARTRERGGRIIAVGTTSARALEAEARRERPFEPGVRQTDIFLKPGEEFLVCQGLITNFHLPRSTLLALVAAFVGYDFMREIYAHAIEKGYRFYSYGDSSLLI